MLIMAFRPGDSSISFYHNSQRYSLLKNLGGEWFLWAGFGEGRRADPHFKTIETAAIMWAKSPFYIDMPLYEFLNKTFGEL
jgi:hypothetical protein